MESSLDRWLEDIDDAFLSRLWLSDARRARGRLRDRSHQMTIGLLSVIVFLYSAALYLVLAGQVS